MLVPYRFQISGFSRTWKSKDTTKRKCYAWLHSPWNLSFDICHSKKTMCPHVTHPIKKLKNTKFVVHSAHVKRVLKVRGRRTCQNKRTRDNSERRELKWLGNSFNCYVISVELVILWVSRSRCKSQKSCSSLSLLEKVVGLNFKSDLYNQPHYRRSLSNVH